MNCLIYSVVHECFFCCLSGEWLWFSLPFATAFYWKVRKCVMTYLHLQLELLRLKLLDQLAQLQLLLRSLHSNFNCWIGVDVLLHCEMDQFLLRERRSVVTTCIYLLLCSFVVLDLNWSLVLVLGWWIFFPWLFLLWSGWNTWLFRRWCHRLFCNRLFLHNWWWARFFLRWGDNWFWFDHSCFWLNICLWWRLRLPLNHRCWRFNRLFQIWSIVV